MRKLSVFVLLALAGLAAAQVPVDHAVRFTEDAFGSTDGSVGVELIDVASGLVTPITGLSPAASQVTAGVLDPTTGSLWVSASGAVLGEIRRLRLNGARVADEALIATVDSGPFDAPRALDFGWNGGLFVMTYDQLWRLEPSDGALELWTNDVYPGDFAALEVDLATGRLWLMTDAATAFGDNALLTWDLDEGPGPPASIESVYFAGFTQHARDITFDGAGSLYVIGADPYFPFVVRATFEPFTLETLPAVVPALEAVRWDRRHDLLHLQAPSSSGPYFTLAPGATRLTVVTDDPPGLAPDAPRDIELNDLTDLTSVFPRRPFAADTNAFRLAAHGLVGDLAGVALVSLNGTPIPPLILGLGAVDAGGFFTTTITVPANALPPGSSAGLRSARRPIGGGPLSLGDEVEVLFR